MLEKHGCPVKEEMKSAFYYSSTLCQVVFQVLHLQCFLKFLVGLIDLRGRIKEVLISLFVIIHRVLYLRRLLTFGKASCSIV